MSFVELSRHAKDVTGQQFGRLRALWPANKIASAKTGAIAVHWMCGCDCGQMKVVVVSDLTRKEGGTESCGCLIRENAYRMGKSCTEHGYSGHYGYRIWSAMIDRCLDKDHHAYENYGGRGISVCSRWLDGESGRSGFECFMIDMGERPSPVYTLDRVDNGKGYSKGNCRWATQKEQMNNFRGNRIVSAFGHTASLATFTGGSRTALYRAVHQRISKYGWSAERALIASGITRWPN